jgi:hypothetical protein
MKLYVAKQASLRQLASDHRRGEWSCVDRASQLRPKPGHTADMVFMRMGNDEAAQIFPLTDNELRVR